MPGEALQKLSAIARSSSGGAGLSLRPKRMRNDESAASTSPSVNSPTAGRAPGAMVPPPISRSASSSAGVGGTCGPSPASAISVQRRSTARPWLSRPIA